MSKSGQKFVARNRAPRVQIEYDVELYGAQKTVQLPFVMGVMADLSGKSQEPLPAVADRKFLEIDIDNFDSRMKSIKPRAAFTVPNTLTGEGNLSVDLTFESMDDFSPSAVAGKVEPLKALLDARTRLQHLVTYMDGKSGAEDLIARLIADTGALSALIGAESRQKDNTGTDAALADLSARAVSDATPSTDATDDTLAALRAAAPEQAPVADTTADTLANLIATAPQDTVKPDTTGETLAALAAAAPEDTPDHDHTADALTSLRDMAPEAAPEVESPDLHALLGTGEEDAGEEETEAEKIDLAALFPDEVEDTDAAEALEYDADQDSDLDALLTEDDGDLDDLLSTEEDEEESDLDALLAGDDTDDDMDLDAIVDDDDGAEDTDLDTFLSDDDGDLDDLLSADDAEDGPDLDDLLPDEYTDEEIDLDALLAEDDAEDDTDADALISDDDETDLDDVLSLDETDEYADFDALLAEGGADEDSDIDAMVADDEDGATDLDALLSEDSDDVDFDALLSDDDSEDDSDLDALLADDRGDDDLDAFLGDVDDTPEPEPEPDPFGTLSLPKPEDRDAPRRKFRIAILGDFTGRAARGQLETGDALAKRKPIRFDVDTIDDVIARFATTLILPIGKDGAGIEVKLNSIDDLHPDELYENVDLFDELSTLRQRVAMGDGAKAIAEMQDWAETFGDIRLTVRSRPRGAAVPADRRLSDFGALIGDISGELRTASPAEDLIRRIVGPFVQAANDPNQPAMLAAVEAALSGAMSAILHHPDFQAIESTWRSLDLLARRITTGSGMEIVLYDVAAEEWAADLSAQDDLAESGLFRMLAEEPRLDEAQGALSAVFGLYTLEETPPHAELMARMAKISEWMSAPFLTAISPKFLDTPKHNRNPLVAKTWDAVRARAEASYVGLVAPRFLLRQPYGAKTEPVDPLDYEEFTLREGLKGMLWANPVVLSAILMAETVNQGGKQMKLGSVMSVGDMPFHYMTDQYGDQVALPCTERLLDTRTMAEVVARGYMPLLSIKGRSEVRQGSFQGLGPGMLAGPWGQSAGNGLLGDQTSAGIGGTAKKPDAPPKAAAKGDDDDAGDGDDLDLDFGGGDDDDGGFDFGSDDSGGDDDLDSLLAGFGDDDDSASDDGEMDDDLAALLEGL